jgi:hypothetical protein
MASSTTAAQSPASHHQLVILIAAMCASCANVRPVLNISPKYRRPPADIPNHADDTDTDADGSG